jgi:hypothetical protein
MATPHDLSDFDPLDVYEALMTATGEMDHVPLHDEE